MWFSIIQHSASWQCGELVYFSTESRAVTVSMSENTLLTKQECQTKSAVTYLLQKAREYAALFCFFNHNNLCIDEEMLQTVACIQWYNPGGFITRLFTFALSGWCIKLNISVKVVFATCSKYADTEIPTLKPTHKFSLNLEDFIWFFLSPSWKQHCVGRGHS